MPFKSEKQRKWMHANEPKMAKKWEKKKENVEEKKERDYKAEYKKFQSSTKSKKYRAELNKYNRKKGTYGNGDGKDASHKGGKIVGFESQSKNRGRAEKSRMKKESQVNELVPPMSVSNPAAYKAMLDKQISKNVKVKTALGNKKHKDHKKAKSLYQRFVDKFKKKKGDKPKKAAPKKQSKSDTDFYKRQFTGESVDEAITVAGYSELGKRGHNLPRAAKQFITALGKKDDREIEKYIDTIANLMKWMQTTLKNPRFNESVDEGQKRDSSNAYMKYYKTYEAFAREVMNLAKTTTKLSGDRTDEKIILKNFKKYVIPFAGLMNSWDKGQQKNPHIDESVNEANNIDKIKDIVKKKSYKRIGGVIVDMQTANAILKVHKALNPANRKKYEKLSISKMADVAWKLMK